MAMLDWLKPKPDIHFHFNDGPFLEISNKAPPHRVVMRVGNEIMHEYTLNGREWTKAHRRYYAPWEIEVYQKNGKKIFHHPFSLEGRTVRVNVDSKSLGDALAWLPQVQAFAQTHPGANIIVSQFWPELFDQSAYPELTFIDPESTVEDCYATYIIGYYFENHEWFHPDDPRLQPLGKVAADVLGISYVERRPVLNMASIDQVKPQTNDAHPTVCIATASTAACKHWQYEDGWQSIVNYLKQKGFKVMVIQKEECELEHIDDQSGDQPITQRIAQLADCEFFIGLGSGLSWLAWALKKPVVLISGFSMPYSEFLLDCQRIINQDVCHGCWNDTNFAFERGDWDWCPRHRDTDRQFECSKQISPDMVIEGIEKLIVNLETSKSKT